MKVITSYNNFSRGKIDHDMMGRFDLPIYKSGSDFFENFYSNFKGNAIYRPGFMDMVGQFEDCRLQEFKFSDNQNYLMVFYENTIRFLSYDSNGDFGWVISGGVPLEVTTTYTLQQCKELQFAQNADVVVITHQSHAPKDLTRTSASSFTFTDHTFDADPFGGEEPACCAFYKGRLYFANTPSKPTTVWGSEAGDYEVFTIPGTVTDESPLQLSIAEISQPITWLFGAENSLVLGNAENVVALNGGGVNTGITADSVEANKTSADGSNYSYPLSKDGLVFYVGKNDRNIYYFSYDLLTESFLAEDANFISYDITSGGIGKIRHKKDRDDIIYGVRGDGVLLTLNFKQKENIIGWHTQKTNGSFKDIAVITDNNGDPKLFALVLRNGEYYIERQADQIEFTQRVGFWNGGITRDDELMDDEAYNRFIAEQLIQCNYLDNSLSVSNLQEGNTITYAGDSDSGTITADTAVFSASDVGKHISYKTATGYESGRFEITGYTSSTVVDVEILQEPTQNTYDNWYLSFSSISGLSQYDGTTISVVSDGGYLDDYLIDGDTIDFDGKQILSAVVGYKYTGIIKSFCLGFQVGAENTQTTMKAITRIGMRCVSSAGGKFGSTLYHLEPVQELSQNEINYLPPIPIDGTKYISYSDDNKKDKFFYIVQDIPLPFRVTSVMVDANYSVTR